MAHLRSYLRFLELSKYAPKFVTVITLLSFLGVAISIGQTVLISQLVADEYTTFTGATPILFVLAAALFVRSLITLATERYSARSGHRIRSEIRKSLLQRVTRDDPMASSKPDPDEISILVTQGIGSLGHFLQRSLPDLVRVMLIPIVIVAMIMIGIQYFETAGLFVIVVLLLTLAPQIYLPLRGLFTDSHLIKESVKVLQRLSEVLAAPVTPLAPDLTSEPAPSLGRVKEIRWTDAEVLHSEDRSVTFRWGIASGAKVTVISGLPGSGKTTLLQALIRIHRLNEGRIFIETNKGTYRIAELSVDQWLDQISWIPQDPCFVAGTIEENLKLIRPRANRQRLTEVLAESNLAVEILPNGLQTTIDQLNSMPTSGLLRRLALARVLLKDAPIIFSDAPLEPIDSNDERQIQAKLKELARNGKLVVTVSNDEEVMAMADRRITLDSARIEPVRILESAQ